MMSELQKFFGRIGDVLNQAPSYSRDTQSKHQEKEQMNQPQEEFIESKSIDSNESKTTEEKKPTKP
jgi:hypothetical protein